MTEKPGEPTITEQIDADEGLASKRKLLTLTSLVLLALSFSGAKVEEANTLILKLSFENQTGLSTLLVVAIMFLLIRYYNYAYKYHRDLYKLWTGRMLGHPFFLNIPPHEPDSEGLVVELEPEGLGIDAMRDRDEYGDWDFGYGCRFLFRRKIEFSWQDRNGDHFQAVGLGFKNHFTALKLECYYQVSSFFIHRENLDITAPYILACTAISSYFFNDSLQAVLVLIAAG